MDASAASSLVTFVGGPVKPSASSRARRCALADWPGSFPPSPAFFSAPGFPRAAAASLAIFCDFRSSSAASAAFSARSRSSSSRTAAARSAASRFSRSASSALRLSSRSATMAWTSSSTFFCAPPPPRLPLGGGFRGGRRRLRLGAFRRRRGFRALALSCTPPVFGFSRRDVPPRRRRLRRLLLLLGSLLGGGFRLNLFLREVAYALLEFRGAARSSRMRCSAFSSSSSASASAW